MSHSAADLAGSARSAPAGDELDRPECMVLLELLPPYSLDDVHRAYKACALKVHPDHGGKPEDFVRLREAYEQAQELVRFRSGRRDWLAAQVDRYMHMQEVVAETERRGGTTEIESIDWMNRSLGDFATLTDRLRAIHYRGRDDGDSFLEYLAENHGSLNYLLELDLSGTRLTSVGLSRLKSLRSLRSINLQQTAATAADVVALVEMPELNAINIRATKVSWIQRMLLAWKHPKIRWLNQSASGRKSGGPSA